MMDEGEIGGKVGKCVWQEETKWKNERQEIEEIEVVNIKRN